MILKGPQSEEIKSIFSSVAHGYDTANDAMTFGIARLWRKNLVKWSGAKRGDKILDCATGTGDLALEFKRAVGDEGQVIGTDFCPEMLAKAPPKAERAGLKVDFRLADAMRLPFSDNQFNVASIAYGIRNVTDPQQALREMARVVKPGGMVMILETGDNPENAFKKFFEFYFRQVVPRVGGWMTGQRQAYEYLNRSSLGFPSREQFVDVLNSTDAFSHCEYKVVFGGASFLYRAQVL